MAWTPTCSTNIDEIFNELCQLQSISMWEQFLGILKIWLRAGLESAEFHSLALPSFGLKKNCIGGHTTRTRDPKLKRPTVRTIPFLAGDRSLLDKRCQIEISQSRIWNGLIVSIQKYSTTGISNNQFLILLNFVLLN